MNNYNLSLKGSANEMQVYFDVPSDIAVSDVRIKVCSNGNIA
jgi:hypothetical protein